MTFLIKLEMRFTDPTASQVPASHPTTRLILSFRSLTFLLRVLRREFLTSELEVLQHYAHWRGIPGVGSRPSDFTDALVGPTVLGVKREHLGSLQWEGWGRIKKPNGGPLKKLMPPDELLMHELHRRGLSMGSLHNDTSHYLQSMLYGYVDPATLRDFEPREWTSRRLESIKDEYDDDDNAGAAEVLRRGEDEDFDELLDVGCRKSKSKYCTLDIRREDQIMHMKKRQERGFAEACMLQSRFEGLGTVRPRLLRAG